MWNRVGVRRGNIVQTAVVSTRASVTVAIGNHMKRRGPHAMEGRTKPMFVRSLLNSALAATSFSGERRRGRAKTGRPSVTM